MNGSTGLHVAVLRSNHGRCLGCVLPAEQVDHIRPRHAGGSDDPPNLAPLCAECNKVKSCLWPGHGYHPWPGFDRPERARQILDAEVEYSVQIYGPEWESAYGPPLPPAEYVPVLRICSRPIHLPRRWNGESGFTHGRCFSCLYPDQAKAANWIRRAAPPRKPVKL